MAKENPKTASDSDGENQGIGPTEVYDPVVRNELKKAAVWIGLALLCALVILLAQPILLIFGGVVLAAMLDGGARLLGRILPIARGMRLAITIFAVFGFLYWTVLFAGSELAKQAVALESILRAQLERIGLEAQAAGLGVSAADFKEIGSELVNSLGRVTGKGGR